jgi:hypothetical protein
MDTPLKEVFKTLPMEKLGALIDYLTQLAFERLE